MELVAGDAAADGLVCGILLLLLVQQFGAGDKKSKKREKAVNTMEQKREELAKRLDLVIYKLYLEFNRLAKGSASLDLMLSISDRITRAAEVLANLYGIVGLEAQIEMLEKALREAEQ